MKATDLDVIMEMIGDIKLIVDRLDYNQSSILNQKLNRIVPIIKSEIDRLDSNKIDINCPRIYIEKVVNPNLNTAVDNIQMKVNDKLQELTLDEYKIIDYNIALNLNDMYSYYWIKYTD